MSETKYYAETPGSGISHSLWPYSATVAIDNSTIKYSSDTSRTLYVNTTNLLDTEEFTVSNWVDSMYGLSATTTNKFSSEFKSEPSINTYSGTRSKITVGETVAYGDILYLHSGGTYKKANATVITTMPGVVIATSAITSGQNGYVLLQGYFSKSGWTWSTYGSLLYVSTTSGAMVDTISGFTSGQQVQIVGYVTSGSTIYFNPNYGIAEVL